MEAFINTSFFLNKCHQKTKPKNLLEASGVEGITPAALNVLAIHLKKIDAIRTS